MATERVETREGLANENRVFANEVLEDVADEFGGVSSVVWKVLMEILL